MKIAMIGTGYVGLVSGVCFSDFGHDVICVDKDAGKIDRLKGGEVPIYEPGLDDLMARNVAAGRLSFTTDLAQAMDGAQATSSPRHWRSHRLAYLGSLQSRTSLLRDRSL